MVANTKRDTSKKKTEFNKIKNEKWNKKLKNEIRKKTRSYH